MACPFMGGGSPTVLLEPAPVRRATFSRKEFPVRLVPQWSARRLAISAAAFVALGVGGAARAAEPTQQELLERVNALQKQVEELKSTQNMTPEQANIRRIDAAVD